MPANVAYILKSCTNWKIIISEMVYWKIRIPKCLNRNTECGNPTQHPALSPGSKDFGHLTRRVDSLEKTLMLGGIGGRRRRGWQRMRWLDGRESEWTPGVGDGQEGLACCNSWGCKESDTTERLNWTELNCLILWGPLLLLPSIYPSRELNQSTRKDTWPIQ